MLRNLLIFSLCIVAITADGQFTILSPTKGLSFKGTEPLQSEIVGQVISASLGNAVEIGTQWSGLVIENPFNLPEKCIVITLTGAESSKVATTGKTYQIVGNSAVRSLNGVTAQLEADNEPVRVINFEDLEEGIESFNSLLGNEIVEPVANTKNLNSELHTADKQYLQSIAYLRCLGENLDRAVKSCNLLIIRLTVDSVAKAHGEKSEAMSEAMKLFEEATKYVTLASQKLSSTDALIVAVVDKADLSRRKRETLNPDKKNPFNLAEYYSEDYPVIFNIILWFMVTFGFALLAICYAIAAMDPGRDSIIYRMTSTRMKKDN